MQEQIKLQGDKYRHADFLQTIPLTNKIYKKLFLKRKPKLNSKLNWIFLLLFKILLLSFLDNKTFIFYRVEINYIN